jgi:hypothetical protein
VISDVAPLAVWHVESLRTALDSVARATRLPVPTRAPPDEEAFALHRHALQNDLALSEALRSAGAGRHPRARPPA